MTPGLEPRLTVERFGRQITVTSRGLAIDGRMVDPAPLTAADAVTPSEDPRKSQAFQGYPTGHVVYRARTAAWIDPAGTPERPGAVRINPELAQPPPQRQPQRQPRPVRDLELDIDL